MAIYTPRGLKIRFGINYAFALMARLYPKVDAFSVLKTAEGLELIPTMLAFSAAIVSFYLKLNPYQIGFYVLVAAIIGKVMTTFGVFIIPGLPKLGTLYSYVSGFGVLFIVLVIYGFISVGWQGVIAFLIAKLLSGIINVGIEFWYGKQLHAKTGEPLTLSEINFLNAYRLHASTIGKTTDLTVSDEELAEENWKGCLLDLTLKWPEVVRRFTQN